MKITIDITEETAACLWADQWEQQPPTPATISFILGRLAENAAANFRRVFPESVGSAVARFREENRTDPAANA